MPKRLATIRAAFFDLGNTLVFYSPSPEGIVARVLERWGYRLSEGKVREAMEEAFKPLREKIRKRIKVTSSDTWSSLLSTG